MCCEYHGDLGGVCGASVLSPCGGLVMAGGEGGRVGVWRSDDGKGRSNERRVACSDRQAVSHRATCPHVQEASSAVSGQCHCLPSSRAHRSIHCLWAPPAPGTGNCGPPPSHKPNTRANQLKKMILFCDRNIFFTKLMKKKFRQKKKVCMYASEWVLETGHEAAKILSMQFLR